jgi:1,4-alpha-glucan branching enzyme
LPEILGHLMLVLHSHIPYVLSHGKSPHGTDWIFESAAESYLPILNACERLTNEGISPKITVNMTPILQEQLADESFKSEFVDYLQNAVNVAIDDQRDFVAKGNLWQGGLAYFWQQFYSRQLEEFKEKHNHSVLSGFKKLQDEGHIEVITSAATHGYLPLLGTDESVQAQVKLGVKTYEKHFGREPRGIWLPECAYRPSYEWSPPVGDKGKPFYRKGVEAVLAENGLQYFFVDSHMLRGGSPLGTYADRFPALSQLYKQFSDSFKNMEGANRSEYESYWAAGPGETYAPVACFARDPETTVQVWSGSHGYPGDPHYLEFHKMHYPGRLRYWRVSENKADLGAKALYEPLHSYERLCQHADHFVELVKNTMANYKRNTGRIGCMVSMYDTELYGHWWFEGPEWLYEVTKRLASDPQIKLVTASEQFEMNPPSSAVHLPEGSWGEGGYHSIWLNEQNAWTWEDIYAAERDLVKLIDKYRMNPEVSPILKQAARELLLLESSDWQFLISTWSARDYAEVRVAEHSRMFKALADMARKVGEGGLLNEQEIEIYKDSELRDNPFQDLDLSYWSNTEFPAGAAF